MTKQGKVGLSYLQISTRFDTQSTDNINVDALLGGLKEVFPSVISTLPPTSGPRGHEYKTDYVFVGLQTIFDDLGKGLIEYTLFDSDVFVPSGVGNAICLLVTNCSNRICYSIPGLQNTLLSLGINAEAIGFSAKAEKVVNFLELQELNPIQITEEKKKEVSELVAPCLIKSVGKSSKKNKKNRKNKKK